MVEKPIQMESLLLYESLYCSRVYRSQQVPILSAVTNNTMLIYTMSVVHQKQHIKKSDNALQIQNPEMKMHNY